MTTTIRWEGLGGFESAVNGLGTRVRVATRVIAERSGLLLEQKAKSNFEGAHRRGAPHVGGSKPNIVTGNLRRSIKADPVEQEGPAVWSVKVGPTAIYGRRVELGYPGGKGRGHQRTRPFPYMAPAVQAVEEEVQTLAEALWAQALRS